LKKSLALLAFLALAWAPVIATAQDDEPSPEGVVPRDAAPRDNVFGKNAKYRAATLAEAKTTVARWLEKSTMADDLRKKVTDLWNAEMADTSGPRLLQRLGESFALVDDKAKKIVEITTKSHDLKDLPSLAWLTDDKLDPLFRDHLRLLIGRWLCQEKLYDESIAVLKDIKPENVIDPASLLFYRSVAFHRLLIKKEGLESIHALLEDVGDSPQRYVAVAGLMEQDLKALKDGSLDDISRRMEDVERRLGLSRAGKVVRKKEDEIVAMLDKLIDELEKQQQQSSSSSSGSPGGGPMNPANQSGVGGPTGPGTVNPKNAQGAGWGELPPHKRQEALQQLGKDFPAHYRAAIEQYFRRIANEPARP
jgi:hypothetical protein